MGRGIAIGTAFGALIAACFSAPGRPAGTGGLDDAGVNGDGTGPDSATTLFVADGDVASCKTDLFLGSGSDTCGLSAWGTLAGSGSGNLTGTTTGELTLGLPSVSGTEQCDSQPDAWNRVTVDVQSVAASNNTQRTFIGIVSASTSESWGIEFVFDPGVGGPTLKTTCVSSALRSITYSEWNPVTQRYIQLERTAPTTLAFRASPDNVTYTPVGTCTVPDASALLAAQVRLSIEQATGNIVTAKFGHIELCHD